MRRIVATANDVFKSLLLDAPELVCDLLPPEDWAVRGAVRWSAIDGPTGVRVSLDSLSKGEARWATLAVQTAVTVNSRYFSQREWESVVLLDEPEEALHVSAARHLVNGLKQWATLMASSVVVATHSPAFLNDQGMRLLHARRGDAGHTELVALPSPIRESPAELGISRSDLLQLYRVIVAVEGEHDRVVLDTLLGDELADLRCLLIPMHGAHNLTSILDTRLIVDFTDAALLAVVDHAEASWLIKAWIDAKAELVAKGKAAARLVLEAAERRGSTKEQRLLLDFCKRAIDSGQTHRVDFVGLSVPDILHLLNIREFVPGNATWPDLDAEWLALPHPRPAWKDWLRAEHGATIGLRQVKRALATMDTIPPDLEHVRQACAALSLRMPRS